MSEAIMISQVLLWICVVALAAVVLALTRQLGLLHERLRPAGALMPGDGPAVGSAAPVLSAATLDGRALRIGEPDSEKRSTLLFFLSPSCPVCKTVLPTLLATAREERERLRIVLASDGEPDEHRRFVQANGLESLPYVVSTELGLVYRVGKLPFVVLIDDRGMIRAKGLVNTREHLESLFEADRLGVASIQRYLEASEAESGAVSQADERARWNGREPAGRAVAKAEGERP